MRGRLGLSFLPSAEKPPLLFSSIALPFGDLKLLCGSRHYIVIQFLYARLLVLPALSTIVPISSM